MEPTQNQMPHTLCPKCNNFILTQNFLIHEARCKGNNLQSSTYTRNSRISNARDSLTRKSSSKGSEQQQRIPCPYCGYGQTLLELDTHPNVCVHREVQCQACKLKFPLSLMEQHELVCSTRNRSLPSQQNRNASQQNRNPDRQRQQPTRPRQQQRPQQPSRQTQERNRQQRRQQPVRPRQQQNRYRVIQEEQQQDDDDDFIRIIDRRRQRMDEPMDLIHMMMGGYAGLRPSNQMRNPFQRSPFQGQNRRVVILDPSALIELLARRARGSGQSGLSKQDIKKFPITKYVNKPESLKEEDQDMCAICYCNFHQGQNCMNLPCKHRFHPQCVGKWLEKNPTCPLCKKNFKGQSNERQRQQRQRVDGQRMGNFIFFDRVNLP